MIRLNLEQQDSNTFRCLNLWSIFLKLGSQLEENSLPSGFKILTIWTLTWALGSYLTSLIWSHFLVLTDMVLDLLEKKLTEKFQGKIFSSASGTGQVRHRPLLPGQARAREDRDPEKVWGRGRRARPEGHLLEGRSLRQRHHRPERVAKRARHSSGKSDLERKALKAP